MTQSNCVENFLSIIRLGIGKSPASLPNNVDWTAVKALAEEQGLLGVMIDGIERMPDSLRPPKEYLLEWIGETLQGYEYRYESCCRAIADLAGFYNSHGYKMMVLKGYTCAMNWPKPEHRPCGDIDIWQFGKQKEADALLAKEKGVKIDKSHHHHTVFNWRDFVVENHFDFINVYQHKSNSKWESIFKDLGTDDTHWVELYGEKVYLPSPDLHALFLFKHLILHFASEGATIRQMLDWAFFVQANVKNVNWEMVDATISRFGLKEIYGVINAICVGDLGFEAKSFPYVKFNPIIKDRVFSDVIRPEFTDQTPKFFFSRLFYRFRRWRANAWKHNLCYEESMWSAFQSGVWNHLMKPRSI